MNRVRLISTISAAVLLAAPALANDSSAELRSGGLVLTRNAAIQMRSEALFISREEVKVSYRFFNTSPKDVTVQVAFPMPDVGGPDLYFVDTPIPDRDAASNFMAFETKVDGKPVKAEVEQKAFAGKREVTAWLKAHGLPLAPYLPDVPKLLEALPKAAQDEAVKLEIAFPDEYDNDGKGMKKHLVPSWTMRSTFHWRQTFPAGKELAVEHRYTPSVGTTAGTTVGSVYSKPADLVPYRQRYCIDESFLAAVEKTKVSKEESAPLVEERIEYVLKTGANWAGPIGDFTLTVDKGSPDALISFCGEGVKKISPTRFEMKKKAFTPTRDLSILILQPTTNN
jgi:hypothetical protein